MSQTNEQYFIIILILMSLVTACKPHQTSFSQSQSKSVAPLPAFHFMQQLPTAMRQHKQNQGVKLAYTPIDAINLQATLVGENRKQAIIINSQGKRITVRHGSVVGQSNWCVCHITARKIELTTSQGTHYELHL